MLATKRLIDSVWTMSFTMTTDTSVTVDTYDRDNMEGYEKEGRVPYLNVIEDDKRTVTHIQISDDPDAKRIDFNWDGISKLEVTNPQHVFTYS